MRTRSFLALWLAGAWACTGAPPAPDANPASSDARGAAPPAASTPTRDARGAPTSDAPSAPTAPTPDAKRVEPTALRDAALILTDPTLLSALEAHGMALDVRLGASAPAADCAALRAHSALYRDFAALVALDDSVAKWRDPDAGTGFAPAHRLFDIRWLSSARTRFELVAVVNRMDRMHATPGACGELRLVYRLAYSAAQVSSRLPMTLNVVFEQTGDCAAIARRWLALERVPATELASAVLAGPLDALAPSGTPPRGPAMPARVETNFQSGRWPSTLRPRLGGHAEYVLRVFDVAQGRLALSTLENTPTQKLHHGARAELRAWLATQTEAIERGDLLVPERFLAERTVSVQPRGIARLANRPFSQIAPLPDARLTRRLDQLSCKGCHASRSLAGFHVLGEDRAETTALNAIQVGLSPHLLAELPWRRSFVTALAGGALPSDPGWSVAARPIADRGSGQGLVGEACTTERDAGFASFTCAAELECKDRYAMPLGVCATPGAVALGEGIELGRMKQQRDALRDAVLDVRLEACATLGGEPVKYAQSGDGFPGGMCHAPCPLLGEQRDHAICGPVPFGKGTAFDGFTKCLSVHGQPFDRCLADDMHPTWLSRCDRATPCRDDYLCVRVPGSAGAGACLPPYFLFQVRVDGHAVER